MTEEIEQEGPSEIALLLERVEQLERELQESREANRALIMRGTPKAPEPEPVPEISEDEALQWLVERKFEEVRWYLNNDH